MPKLVYLAHGIRLARKEARASGEGPCLGYCSLEHAAQAHIRAGRRRTLAWAGVQREANMTSLKVETCFPQSQGCELFPSEMEGGIEHWPGSHWLQ